MVAFVPRTSAPTHMGAFRREPTRVVIAAAGGGGGPVTVRGGSPKRSPTTGSDTSATASVTLSGAWQPQTGDVLHIVHKNDFYALSNMPTPTVGGSSTGVTSIINADAGTNMGHIKTYYYVVTSTGDTTVSVTETGSHDEEKQIVVYVLAGVDTTGNPVDGSSSGFSATGIASQVIPQITGMTLANNFLIADICSGGGSSSNHYQEPATMTEAYDELVGNMNSGGATEQLASSADTGTRTFISKDGSNNDAAIPWAGVMVAYKTATGGGGGPITQPVNQVTETDIAQPLGRLKTAGIGQVAETMVAQPFTVRKTRTLGQVVETAVVQPVAWAPKNRLVNQVTETSVAQPVTRRKTVAVNMVTQTNVAQPVTSRKTAVIGQVATTMVAQPVTRVKSRVINQVSETDVSQPIARLKVKLLGQVVTTMVAQTITRAGVVNRVTETEVAQPISRLKAKATGMVTTTMVSQPLARVKLRVVGMVTTTMVSQPLTRVKARATGLVTTTALAQPTTHRKLTVVGMVVETDLGRPVRPPQRVAIGRAVETSTVGVVVWLAPILSRFPVDVSVAIDRGTVTVALTRSTVTVDMTRPVRSVEL